MLLAEKFIDKQIISLDEGRIVGEVKDFYVDLGLEQVTAIYLGSEGLIRRKPKVIKQNTVQLYGIDVLFVQNSSIIIEGAELDKLEEIDTWLRREDLQGRHIQSPTGSEVGQVDDIMFDEMGKIIGFGLTKIKVEGPIAENQAISRGVMIEPGDKDKPLVIDLVKAEQQHWFFENLR